VSRELTDASKGEPVARKLEALLKSAQRKRDLRDSTVESYRRFLTRIGVVDDSLSLEELEARLLDISNVNTRRSTVTAIRAVLGVKLKIQPGIPRRYDLPSEDVLRFALMQCKYELRALLMMYGGLRLGEACAITSKQLNGDRLVVDRQVLEFWQDKKHVVRIASVKTFDGVVIVPQWLAERVKGLDTTDTPGSVRAAMHHWGKRHGIQLNPHMLRHWHATTLLNRGVNVVAVSKQLRHSDPSITLRAYIQTGENDIRNAF
jgi:integrase